MTQVISDRRDIEFVLHEQLDAQSLSKLYDGFADFNKKTIDLVISEARNFAVKELLPANKEGDQEGCRLENGKVTTPEAFKRLLNCSTKANGWQSPKIPNGAARVCPGPWHRQLPNTSTGPTSRS